MTKQYNFYKIDSLLLSYKLTIAQRIAQEQRFSEIYDKCFE